MKKNKSLTLEHLVPLANSVGDFIQYWGFKGIQGKVWTLIYLSQKPLSPLEIAKALGASKTLLTFAIQDLLYYKLIKPAKSENLKTKRYVAEDDVFEVIIEILKNREMALLTQSQERHGQLVDQIREGNGLEAIVASDRLQSVGLMIAQAKVFLKQTIGMQHTALKPFRS